MKLALTPANVTQSISKASPSLSEQKTTPALSFGDMVKNEVVQAAQAQRSAEAITMAVANGENVPTQDVIAAVNRADMTLQTMLAVRDKAVDAYQEIMRMPI